MKMIVGLGNPGLEYEGTRHNIGFMAVDQLMQALDVRESPSRQARALTAEYKPQSLLFVKPLTFMNLSGEAVGPLMRWHKLSAEDIIVIHDDLDLPAGKIRIRTKGSAGGHNGIKSLLQHIGSEQFVRIKIGIGRPPQDWDVMNFVLSRFPGSERRQMDEVLETVRQAVLCIVQQGVTVAMNQFNR